MTEWIFGPSEETKNVENILSTADILFNERNKIFQSSSFFNCVVCLLNSLKEGGSDEEDEILSKSIKSMLYNNYSREELSSLNNGITNLLQTERYAIEMIQHILSQLKECSNLVQKNVAENIFFLLTLIEKDILLTNEKTKSKFISFLFDCTLLFLLKQTPETLKDILSNADNYKKIVEKESAVKKDVESMRKKGCVKSKLTVYSSLNNILPKPRPIVSTRRVTIPQDFQEKMTVIHHAHTTATNKTQLNNYLFEFRVVDWNAVSRDKNLVNNLDLFSKENFLSLNKSILEKRCLVEKDLADKIHTLNKKFLL